MTALGSTLAAAPFVSLPIRGQSLPTLQISLPPMIESFPIAFGDDQAVFPDHGLQVEPVGFSKVSDRNVSLLTNTIQGALSDISSVVQLLANDAEVQITSTAYEAVADHRRYALIAQPWANVTELSGLLGRLSPDQRDSIGLNRRTDIEFETDRLIQSIDKEVDESTFYADWSDTLQLATLIGSGSWLAGVLPEPAGSYLEYITGSQSSPVLTIADFKGQDLVPSIFVFQSELIDSNPDLIESFYAGYEASIAELTAMNHDQVINIALDAALGFFFPSIDKDELPEGADEFLAEYLLPTFPAPRSLAAEEYDRVADWTLGKSYIDSSVPFDLAVTERFSGILSRQS